MDRRLTRLILLTAIILAVGGGVVACGKDGGFGIGGKVIITGGNQ